MIEMLKSKPITYVFLMNILNFSNEIDVDVRKTNQKSIRVKRQAYPQQHAFEALLLTDARDGLDETERHKPKELWVEEAVTECSKSDQKPVNLDSCVTCQCQGKQTLRCELASRDCRLEFPRSIVQQPMRSIYYQGNRIINSNTYYNRNNPGLYQNIQNYQRPNQYNQIQNQYYQASSNGRYNQWNMQYNNNPMNRNPNQNFPPNSQGPYSYNQLNLALRNHFKPENVNNTIDPNQVIDHYKELTLKGTFGNITKQIDNKNQSQNNTTVTNKLNHETARDNQSKNNSTNDNQVHNNTNVTVTNTNIQKENKTHSVNNSNFRKSLLSYNYSNVSEINKTRLTNNLKRFSLLDLLKSVKLRTHTVKKMMIKVENILKNTSNWTNQTAAKVNTTNLDPSLAVLDYEYSNGKLNETKLIKDVQSFSLSDLIYAMRVRMHTVRKMIRRMEMIITSDWSPKEKNDTDINQNSTSNSTHITDSNPRRTEIKSVKEMYMGEKVILCEDSCLKKCNSFFGHNETSYCKNNTCFCF